MFESVFTEGTTAEGFFFVLTASLIFGIVYAFLSCVKSRSSGSFSVATALLPMAVATVIALVNGNLGAGVAIAGAFSLVRFRSAPGTAKEIAVIFIAMAGGLAFGMGYVVVGGVFLLISGALLFFAEKIFSEREAKSLEKILKVTIPETLDYTTVFDDLFEKYTKSAELQKVKSSNMGSMFRLSYRIALRDGEDEKSMIDEIRQRNGNLEVMVSRIEFADSDL